MEHHVQAQQAQVPVQLIDDDGDEDDGASGEPARRGYAAATGNAGDGGGDTESEAEEECGNSPAEHGATGRVGGWARGAGGSDENSEWECSEDYRTGVRAGSSAPESLRGRFTSARTSLRGRLGSMPQQVVTLFQMRLIPERQPRTCRPHRRQRRHHLLGVRGRCSRLSSDAIVVMAAMVAVARKASEK